MSELDILRYFVVQDVDHRFVVIIDNLCIIGEFLIHFGGVTRVLPDRSFQKVLEEISGDFRGFLAGFTNGAEGLRMLQRVTRAFSGISKGFQGHPFRFRDDLKEAGHFRGNLEFTLVLL